MIDVFNDKSMEYTNNNEICEHEQLYLNKDCRK